MKKRVVLAALLAALLLIVTPSARAQTNSGLSVTTTGHGVQLRLVIPHQQYPFNSLVRVQVAVRNTSHAPVTITGYPRNCVAENPSVEVLGDAGAVIYPPSPLHYIPPPCPALLPGHEGRVLQPGGSVQVPLYAFLHGNQIRASVTIQRGQKTYTVKGADIPLRLGPAESPQARVAVQSGLPATIDVQADATVTGPPIYQMSLACSDANGGEVFHQVLFWTRATSSHFVANCDSPLEWHLIAGWPGHTAIVADYVMPKE
ncbi:MAG TPA: hypothetical protein VF898_02850 [Chloroflexota bacterium]